MLIDLKKKRRRKVNAPCAARRGVSVRSESRRVVQKSRTHLLCNGPASRQGVRVCVSRRWLPKNQQTAGTPHHHQNPPPPPHRTWQPASSSSSSFFSSLAATKLNPAEQHHVLYFYVGPRLFWKRLNGSKNTYITGAGGESSSCVYITVPEIH